MENLSVQHKTAGFVIHVRWMIRRDMPTVLAIEESSPEPHWTTEDEFLFRLRQRTCVGMVAEVGADVVGFMIYEIHKDRLGLLKFVVHSRYRRSWIGRAMMSMLFVKLSPSTRNRIVPEVRETNLAAQLFFRSMGFRAIRIIKGEVDSYLMQYRCESLANLPSE